MIKMDIEHVISTFVEAMLPRFSNIHTVLVMSVDLRVTKKDSRGPGVWRRVHLMFWRPNNYTKVFWSVSKDSNSYVNITEWELKCDHDSCWRTDGVGTPFFELAFSMMKKLSSSVSGCRDVDVTARFVPMSGDEPHRMLLENYKYDRDARKMTVKFIPRQP